MTAIQGRLRASGADVSWTRPEGMHLTLKFLGEAEEKMRPEMEAALSAAVRGRGIFSLDVVGIGTFPDIRRPRVIWIGLKEHGNNLIRLQRSVEEEFNKIGFSSEDREFTPHITLGRIRSQKNVEKLLSLIEKLRDVELNGFDASCVHLMQSQLRPTGAVYTELYAAPLK